MIVGGSQRLVLLEAGRDLVAQPLMHPGELGETRRRDRRGARTGACLLAHEGTRPIESGRRDAQPDVSPEDVRERHHRLRGDQCERGREDVVARHPGAQDEAGAAGAAHPEHVPGGCLLERRRVLPREHEDLIPRLGLRATPRRKEHIVRLERVRDRRALLLDRDRVIAAVDDRRDAATQVATRSYLRGRRRDEQLLGRELGQVLLVGRRAVEMVDHRPDLDVMHREHHSRSRAGAGELVASGRQRRERDLVAAEALGHVRREGSAAP